jgi:hypothetical protein
MLTEPAAQAELQRSYGERKHGRCRRVTGEFAPCRHGRTKRERRRLLEGQGRLRWEWCSSFSGKGEGWRRKTIVFRIMGEYGSSTGGQGRFKGGCGFNDRLSSDDRRSDGRRWGNRGRGGDGLSPHGGFDNARFQWRNGICRMRTRRSIDLSNSLLDCLQMELDLQSADLEASELPA